MNREPGVYPGLPMADYLATHAVSASLLHTIEERCPLAAWHDSWLNPKRVVDVGSRAMNAGTIAHGILLEGSIKNVAVIDPNEYPTKTTGNIPDGWTNKDIRAARDMAIAEGKTPILKPQFQVIEAMAEAARAYLEVSSEPAIQALFAPGGGDSEFTVVWDEDGVRYRLRADRISKDRRLIGDYKTVTRTAHPAAFARGVMASMGYDMSAAHYQVGIEKTFGERPDYVFFVQEQEPPYLCSLVSLEPAYFDHAHMKVSKAKDTWRSCAKSGKWPGYPTRVAYAELPPWEAARHEERHTLNGIPYQVDQLWEKPEAVEARAAARKPVEYPEHWLGPQA